jgi:hypothetical protein
MKANNVAALSRYDSNRRRLQFVVGMMSSVDDVDVGQHVCLFVRSTELDNQWRDLDIT